MLIRQTTVFFFNIVPVALCQDEFDRYIILYRNGKISITRKQNNNKKIFVNQVMHAQIQVRYLG